MRWGYQSSSGILNAEDVFFVQKGKERGADTTEFNTWEFKQLCEDDGGLHTDAKKRR